MAAFIGLNPSTATHKINDPTVTRCINYAKRWGCDGMYMLNMFGYRATDPADMKKQSDPVGARNLSYVVTTARESDVVICCWGNHGSYRQQSVKVLSALKYAGIELHCLDVAKTGHPKHPLYLRVDLEPIPYEWSEAA
jgi:hypothetical protein